MKEFDYIILGGGCAGLSLAYELNINKKLRNLSFLKGNKILMNKIKINNLDILFRKID